MNKLMVPPAVGTQDGNWVWDGTRWVCDPDCGPPCPPPSVLQPGGVLPPYFAPPVTQPPWYPGANGGVSFSGPGMPPPNPIRGALWWDGTVFWMFDGAAWVDVGGAGAQSGGAGASTGPTPPQSPAIGALWWDGNALLVWDGFKWDVAGGATSTGTSAPANPQPGQQWFNGTTLYIWDGKAWVPTSQTHTFIQGTAPPSPSPGDQWWNGTQMRIWDGSQWELVGPGATVGPVPTTTESFTLFKTNNSPGMGVNTWAIVPFTSTPTVDISNGWQGGTNKFQPTQAGVYWFGVAMYLQGNGVAGSYEGIALLKNDTGAFTTNQLTIALSIDAASVGFSAFMQATGMAKMNGTTDFVRLWGYTSDGTFYANANLPAIHAFLMP